MVVPPCMTNPKMFAIAVAKPVIGPRIAPRKPVILPLVVSLVVVAVVAVVLVVVLVARMVVMIVAVDTTLVMVEGEMAILAHDVNLLHGNWRPQNLVNLKL